MKKQIASFYLNTARPNRTFSFSFFTGQFSHDGFCLPLTNQNVTLRMKAVTSQVTCQRMQGT